MGGLTIPDPLEKLKKVAPPAGPLVQNMGGMQTNGTAPLDQRPVAQPAVATAPPGPVPAPIPPAAPPLPPPAAAVPPPAAAVPPPPAALMPGSYGPSGGTGAQTGSLEDQLRGYISGGLNGATSRAFINRARGALGAGVEGQRATAVNRINNDAIQRGLFRSGIPSEQAAAAGTAAQGSFASGLADILNNTEKTDIAARGDAAAQAGNLLGMNRSWDQYTTQRTDQQNAQNAANSRNEAAHQFTYIDPDTGQSYQMDDRYLS